MYLGRDNPIVTLDKDSIVNLDLCLCGCGKQLVQNLRGYTKRWIRGHHLIGKHSHNWHNGIIIDNGYVRVYRPDHPCANSMGYISEHRLVYEYYLLILFDEVIYIPKKIEIDHRDKNRKNNALINLRPLTKSEHSKCHIKGRIKKGIKGFC